MRRRGRRLVGRWWRPCPARNLGMGCAQGIRNPQAHPSPDITEQEALEQVAALSVLARWVDECDVVGVADGAAGE